MAIQLTESWKNITEAANLEVGTAYALQARHDSIEFDFFPDDSPPGSDAPPCFFLRRNAAPVNVLQTPNVKLWMRAAQKGLRPHRATLKIMFAA